MAGAPIGGNINQMAAQGIQGAGMGTVNAYMQPVGQIASTDLTQYQNPYTEQVINATQQDILRGAQQGINALDYQAGRAGAFGGSRHGVALGELGTGVAQQLAQTSAQQRQAAFQNAQQTAQQDIQNRMAGTTSQLAAANQLANISNLGFNMGQTVNKNLLQQGAMEQAMQQALIDAGKQQYAGYTGAPQASLNYVNSALGSTPTPQTTTQSSSPGLFDYLTAGAAMYGAATSDMRLKTNITKVDNVGGFNVYTWDWNDTAKSLNVNDSNTKGVMAQEVLDKMPEAVVVHPDGYYMVKYDMLPAGIQA